MNLQWNPDGLRIVSMAAVVFIHMSVRCWSQTNVHASSLMIMHAHGGAIRGEPPIFVMIVLTMLGASLVVCLAHMLVMDGPRDWRI